MQILKTIEKKVFFFEAKKRNTLLLLSAGMNYNGGNERRSIY